MKLEKLLARGLAGWLQYEHACQRGAIFSEKYLSVPIAQILNTKFGDRVYSEIKHPILGDLSPGRGRPPELDFTIQNEKLEIIVAIESKWIGKTITKQTVERIVWDLVRLAMMGNNDNVKCYFVLAGKKKHLTRLFKNKHFIGETSKKGIIRPVLRTTESGRSRFRVDSPTEDRIKLLQPIFKLCQDIELPLNLGTGQVQYYPKDAFNYDYQAYVWEVIPKKQNLVFKPKNSINYKI